MPNRPMLPSLFVKYIAQSVCPKKKTKKITQKGEFSYLKGLIQQFVGLGDSCNPTHTRKMSGYAIANPTYLLNDCYARIAGVAGAGV